ncbi:hypothetical protein ACFXTO_036588 [Malus domestica]
MPAPIKIYTRQSFRNRRGACSENRRGVCFLKSWAAQRPRGSISEIEEAFAFSKAWAAQRPRRPISEIEEAIAFSKAGLLRDHEDGSQKSKRHLLFQPCQHLSHAHSVFAEIMGILSKTSGEVEST